MNNASEVFRAFLGGLVLFLAFAQAGRAAALTSTLYTSPSAFDTATAGLSTATVVNFDELDASPLNDTYFGRAAFDGSTYAAVGFNFASPNGYPLFISPGGLFWNASNSLSAGRFPFDPTFDEPTGTPLRDDDDLVLTLAPSCLAVGFTLVDNGSFQEDEFIQFIDAFGGVIAHVDLPADFTDFRAFIGIVSPDRPVARINIVEAANDDDDINYDDFTCFRGIAVAIDIKPGGDHNSINCQNDKAVIPVAVLTTETFDATAIDHTTVSFEGAKETHVDRNGVARRHEQDVDSDGDTDLVFHFRLSDTGLNCASTEGTLSGATLDGDAIEGTDSVGMVPAFGWGKPVGSEFQVNSYTTGNQRFPSVGLDATGNFVVVWDSYGEDGSSDGIFGQRFDAIGNALGGEFQVNSHTTGRQYYPRVGSDASGNFVVVWQSVGQDGSDAGIFGQRFNAAANPVGGEFQVNSYTTVNQRGSVVGVHANGNFVVVWQSYGQDGSGYSLFGQRFNAAGNRVGGEFQVNSYTTGNQLGSSLAFSADGGFVVAWESNGQDGHYGGIFGQRFDPIGNKVGGEFQVNSYTTDHQFAPAVGSDAFGNFVVAWTGSGQDGSYGGIFGQRFDSTGNKVGGEFQVNSYTTGNQYYPMISPPADGQFVVVWWNAATADIIGRRYDRTGNAMGGEFQINSDTTGSAYPAAGWAANGDFVVVWQSYGQDGSADGIFAQRFSRARR